MKLLLVVLLVVGFSNFTYGEEKDPVKKAKKMQTHINELKKEPVEISVEDREYNFCFASSMVEIIQLSFFCVQQMPCVGGVGVVQDCAAPCFKDVYESADKAKEDCVDKAENVVAKRRVE